MPKQLVEIARWDNVAVPVSLKGHIAFDWASWSLKKSLKPFVIKHG